jgi:hypothetical protein
MTSRVSLARNPELVFLSCPPKGHLVPLGTIKAGLPRLPCCRSRHRRDDQRVGDGAVGDELLCPFSIQPSPSARACVRIATASLPETGFSQSPAAQLAAFRQRHQILALLGLAGEASAGAPPPGQLCAADRQRY